MVSGKGVLSLVPLTRRLSPSFNHCFLLHCIFPETTFISLPFWAITTVKSQLIFFSLLQPVLPNDVLIRTRGRALINCQTNYHPTCVSTLIQNKFFSGSRHIMLKVIGKPSGLQTSKAQPSKTASKY